MRRPLVLATTLAAELAVGSFAFAPPVAAQATTDPALDPTSIEPPPVPGDTPTPVPAPVRSGRIDAVPVDVPAALPEAASAIPTVVRSGRLDAPAAEQSSRAPTDPPAAGRDEVPDEGLEQATSPGSSAPRARTDRPNAPTRDSEASGSTGASAAAPNPLPNETPVPSPSSSSSPTSHVVVAGDHLWAIAAQQVASAIGRPPHELAAGDVVTYWVQLCMMNRPHLRSTNPSLVYPGEVIQLPALG